MTFFAKFPIEGVKKIYEHSIANPVFEPTFSQLFEGRYRKDGKDIDIKAPDCPTADEVDKSKIPRQFKIVKDTGAYILANTEKPLLESESKHFVVYCEGCDPNVDEDYWERQQQAFGGSDFTNALPLEWLKMAIDNAERTGIDMMIIKVTKEGFQLMTNWE